MILILSEPLDVHADYVAAKLQQRNADFLRFHPADFPTSAKISLAYTTTGRVEYILETPERLINLNQIQSVWYRRPGTPIPHPEIPHYRERESVIRECQDYLDDVWNSLDCLFLPAPQAVMKRAQMKASQLKIAGMVGFEIPPTLITNDPKEFLEFYRQHHGRVISKLAGFSFFRTQDNPFCRYTEVVSTRDVGYARTIQYCPMIFQAYVPKRVELRVTVVGRQAFAAEIRSQISNRTRHDWRRYDRNQTPYTIHQLPSEIEGHCIELVARLGLCYGAIDLVFTPDGRYVFLEINPNGQFLWTEYKAGLPIADAICDLLIAGPSKQPSVRPALASC